MDAADLTQDQRDKVKRDIIHHREDLARLLNRMKEKGWYTDDSFLNSIDAAVKILHAAVQEIGATQSRPPRPGIQKPTGMSPQVHASGPLPPNAYDHRKRHTKNWHLKHLAG